MVGSSSPAPPSRQARTPKKKSPAKDEEKQKKVQLKPKTEVRGEHGHRLAVLRRKGGRAGYMVQDRDNEERYYLHVEPLKVEGIMREAYILNKAVQEAKNEKLFGGRPKHFQTIIDSGQTKTYRFAVLTLPGPSLLQLQAKAGGYFQ